MFEHVQITTSKNRNGAVFVQDFEVIAVPLAKEAADTDGWVKGVVSLDAGFLVAHDTEAVLDKLSELLVGDDLLMDISYKVLGVDPENEDHLYIEVRGDAYVSFDREQ